MHGWEIKGPGGLEQLELREMDDLAPEDSEVLVEVKAVAMNGVDLHVLKGQLPGATYPTVPGVDMVGVVVAVGSSVSDWTVGDRVSIYPLLELGRVMGEHFPGGLREFVCVDQQQLVRIPRGVSFETAACLPATYATVNRMLSRGSVQKGESVVVIGASGGVGTAVLQMGSMLGARVIACSRDQGKLDAIDSSTLEGKILYQPGELAADVNQLLGDGADVCVNFVGARTWDDALRCLRPQGRVLVVGAMRGDDPPAQLRRIFGRELSVIGSNLWDKEDQIEVLDLARSKKIIPTIHEIVPFSELPRAYRLLEEETVVGKVVVVPASSPNGD